MNPQATFCPNRACSARGQVGQGNIRVHSLKERRYRCMECGQTFSETKGTALYEVRKLHQDFVRVVTLLGHGCPVQAIVAAFDVDERTVTAWQRRAGEHCRTVHEHVVGQSQLDLRQVQADEIKVKTQSGVVWMALAVMVSTRLWLGGAVSATRDKVLLAAVVAQVVRVALCRPLVWAVDGLAAYIGVIQRAFRTPLRSGKRGAPPKIGWPNIGIVQVIKRRAAGHLGIERRVYQGDPALVQLVIATSQGGSGGINTAFIERLNATFRQCLACLGRRSRALARTLPTLEQGMFLVGCLYNFCTPHDSLRLPLYVGRYGRRRWVHRTPAIAAGLTDHIWSVDELLTFKVPPPPFVPPKRRGRPPNSALFEAAA
jgi:transposase-like protein